MKSLHQYHPIVIFFYFFVVIGLTMFYMHPVLLGISFFGAVLLSLFIQRKKFLSSLKWLLPFMFIAAIINPLITHNGEIILLYVNYQPITLEAIVYGFAMSVMLLSVVFWFGSFNEIMTSDKFLYLFGRISPAVALLISLTMRLIPLFFLQIKKITNAQRTIGMDPTTGSLWHRIKSAATIISILISWALENAIETADSMKARGYGLKNRSTFSLFKFDRADGIVTTVITCLFFVALISSYFGWNYFAYYPTFSTIELNMTTWIVFISYFALIMLPIVIELLEVLKWRSLKLNS